MSEYDEIERQREEKYRRAPTRKRTPSSKPPVKVESKDDKPVPEGALAGPPKTAKPPKMRVEQFTKPKTTFPKVIQNFYDKSKFPSKEELDEQFLKHGYGNKQTFAPGSIGEAVNRIGWVTTELIGGGVREATLGLTGTLGAEDRPGARSVQVAGGLVTPTTLDYAATAFLNKLAVRKTGRKIIDALLDDSFEATRPVGMGDDIAAEIIKKNRDQVKQFEKIFGPDAVSTYKLRNELVSEPKFLDLAKKLKTQPEADFSPEAARQFEKFVGATGYSTSDLRNLAKTVDGHKLIGKLVDSVDDAGKWTTDDAIQFEKLIGKKGVSTYDIRTAPPSADPTSTIWGPDGLTIYDVRKLSKEQLEDKLKKTTSFYEGLLKKRRGSASIIPSLEQQTGTYKDLLEEIYDGEVFIDFLKTPEYLEVLDIDASIPVGVLLFTDLETREKALREVARLDVPSLDNRIEQIRGHRQRLLDRPDADSKEVQDLISELNRIETNLRLYITAKEKSGDVVTPEDFTDEAQDEEQIQKTTLITKQEEEPTPTPDPDPDPDPLPDPTPPPTLTDREKEERRKINLRLFNGPKQKYRVVFHTGGQVQEVGVEARSFHEAMNRAQMRRRGGRRLPDYADIVKVGR